MGAAEIIDIYDRLTNAPDERTRARVIAEAFAALEERYPHLSDMATRSHVSETELRLVKEIEAVRNQGEQIRAELKETELRLHKEIEGVRLEIEQVRSELKETELRLHKEIEGVRLEIEQVRSELKETELGLRKEIELVRAELKETELRLTKEIDQVRGETRTLVEKTRANLLQWMFVFWASQFAAIAALLWRLWGAS